MGIIKDPDWPFPEFSRLTVCSDFLERVHSDVCHLCLQPKAAHPGDDDLQYWAQWTVFCALLELHPVIGLGADRQPL